MLVVVVYYKDESECNAQTDAHAQRERERERERESVLHTITVHVGDYRGSLIPGITLYGTVTFGDWFRLTGMEKIARTRLPTTTTAAHLAAVASHISFSWPLMRMTQEMRSKLP